MDRLENLALFVSIVERRGMAAAGREHGLSPASVSERLARLERDYGARLLNRTTRSVSPTDAGRRLLDGARHLVADAAELEADVRLGANRLAGTIRMSAPVDLGHSRIAPLLDEFMAEHDEVRVDLRLTDGRTDLVERGLDLAIRYGALADSSLIARPLATSRRRVCASPAYLAAHGTPAHPDELDEHECLVMRFGGELHDQWPFMIDGRHRTVSVRGRRVSDDGLLVRAWCLAGHGLAMKSDHDIEDDVRAGRLVTCLHDFREASTTLQVVYPSSSRVPARVRALVERLVATFADGGDEASGTPRPCSP